MRGLPSVATIGLGWQHSLRLIARSINSAMMLHKQLAVALVVTSGLCSLLTVWASQNLPGFWELNPLMRPIADSWVLPVWKTAAACFGALFALLFSQRIPKVVTIGLSVAVAIVTVNIVLDLLEYI
ncbi:hypothetical protein ES703_113202 [subsurface metagenome]